MIFKEARLDLNRIDRLGMIEAIWGENKSAQQIADILKTLKSEGQFGFVTRVSLKKASEVAVFCEGTKYHEAANCLTVGNQSKIDESLGEVILLSGGTSDLAVTSEAELALNWHGVKTDLIIDVGVAGLHRLLGQIDRLKKAKVLIACAGMEGALPTVVAGLVPQPVIAVPISVGYGVSKGGFAALNGMLASCSPGLVVVNIDNGYGAAMAALRILMVDAKK